MPDNPAQNFLDAFFAFRDRRQRQQNFNAEQLYKQQEFQQHEQEFQQRQALQEREFTQRQQYHNMLGEQAKQVHKDLQSQRADQWLQNFTKEGGLPEALPQAQSITSQAEPIQQPQGLLGQMPAGAQGPNPNELFQQLPQRQIPQLPITLDMSPESQRRPGYNPTAPPSFVPKGRPDLVGKEFLVPDAEEKARQAAAGKAAEGKALWPTLTPEQYTGNENIFDTLGVKPGQQYEPKIQEGLLTHILGKNKPGEIQDKWKMFTAAEAKRLNKDPGALNSDELGHVAKLVADDSQTTSAAFAASLMAQLNQQKIQDLKESGETFGERLAANPSAKAPDDVHTQIATDKYMMQKYGVHAPAKLGQRAESTEDFAARSIQAVDYVNRMLDNPRLRAAIEKRQGPGWGRVGNLDQEIGKAVGDFTEEDRSTIQEFRSQLNYTRFQEGQALFGGRIPIQLMQELSSTSPRIQQARAEIKGALRAVKNNAQGTLFSYGKERYGAVPPDPWFAAKDIPKKDFVDKAITTVPTQLQDMEVGEQRMVTQKDANGKIKAQSMFIKHQDGSITERPIE